MVRSSQRKLPLVGAWHVGWVAEGDREDEVCKVEAQHSLLRS